MTRRLLIGIITVLAIGALGRGVEAHEIGKTQVAAVFEPVGHTYQIDIAVDPDALVTRLQKPEIRN